MEKQPLTLSFDAGLDFALRQGWARWVDTARNKGSEHTTQWIAQRGELGLDPAELALLIATILENESPFERAMAASELAEYVQGDDDALAATMWEGMLTDGREANDSEIYFEGLSNLAEIEEEYGDPQAAAALYIDFLDWTRESGHSTEAEAIFDAFDQLIALAEADGHPTEAAIYEHAQTRFYRFVDGDDSRIVSENWDPGAPPYAVWED